MYVGEKERKFKISKTRLQPILPHIELDDYISHHLPDLDERTFELFEHWLRNKTLDELNQDEEEEEAKATMLEYLDLYFEATEWGIQDLWNVIMDRFRGRNKCEDGYFPCFLIKKIYDNTEEGAPLRRYMVDGFVFKSDGWAPDHLAECFNRHCRKGNHDFLLDCYKAALALARADVVDADFHVEFGESPGCEYHKHRDGKECGLERARKRRKIGQTCERTSGRGGGDSY